MSTIEQASVKRAAIIGGGWAGCAAAVSLAHTGWQVTVFEAAPVLGGRARRVEINGQPLDNGQHILLGAYAESLRLMRLVGMDPNTVLLRLPLQMRYPEKSAGMTLVAPRLLAPFHLLVALLRASGLNGDDKLALARFITTARWIEWRLNSDCTVLDLLDRFNQTPRLYGLLWRPLCLAALNTPPERASAQVFLNVLRDSIGAKRSASDMLLPKRDLSALFAERAADFVTQHGGAIKLAHPVHSLVRVENGWRIDDSLFDGVVVATPPGPAATLLDGLADLSAIRSFDYEPITTCYLQYAPQTRLDHPFYALVDHPAGNHWGQFVFDRGHLDASQSGWFAVVISASNNAMALEHDVLAAAIAGQLATVFRRPELAQPLSTKILSEGRATLACTPKLVRPDNATGHNQLVIAGDYTAGDYPATLEAAVRSGIRAADLLNGKLLSAPITCATA